jgi:hypothetical protein
MGMQTRHHQAATIVEEAPANVETVSSPGELQYLPIPCFCVIGNPRMVQIFE